MDVQCEKVNKKLIIMNTSVLLVLGFAAFAYSAVFDVPYYDRWDVHHNRPIVGNAVHDPDYYKEDLTVSKSRTVGQYPYHHEQYPYHLDQYPYQHEQYQYHHGQYPYHHGYQFGKAYGSGYYQYPQDLFDQPDYSHHHGYGYPYSAGVHRFLKHIYGYGHDYPHHYGDFQNFVHPYYGHLYGGDYQYV